MCSPHFYLEKSRPKEIAQMIELNVILDIFLKRICVDKYVHVYTSLLSNQGFIFSISMKFLQVLLNSS